jgi:hypothetical protein
MRITSKRLILLAAMAVCATVAVARTEGIYNPKSNAVGDNQGIDSNAATSAPVGNFLLSDTGSALLVNIGVKFLVQ